MVVTTFMRFVDQNLSVEKFAFNKPKVSVLLNVLLLPGFYSGRGSLKALSHDEHAVSI